MLSYVPALSFFDLPSHYFYQPKPRIVGYSAGVVCSTLVTRGRVHISMVQDGTYTVVCIKQQAIINESISY